MKNESFEDADYPNLSKAIQHFKDTEKGRDEVCETIEIYANEIAIDMAIDICKLHNDSKEKTLEIVSEKFPQVSEEQISKRISELWNT